MILVAALLCGGCSQETKCHLVPKPWSPPSVSVDDLNGKVSVIGRLGKALGTMVTIRGRVIQPGERNDYWSNNMAHNLIQVESVDGQAIQPMDMQIDLQPNEKFPANGEVAWIGYEDGGFEGLPPQTNKMLMSASQPVIQGRSRLFVTTFHALKPAPSEQSPGNPSTPPAGQFG